MGGTLIEVKDKKRERIFETDLYPPIADYLQKRGYSVRSEVRDCDVTAVHDDELVIVELKRNFNTELLIQATKRQRMTPLVYVAVPRPPGRLTAKQKGMLQLLRRLELGLFFVRFSGGGKLHDHEKPMKATAELVFHPEPFQVRKDARARALLLKENALRTGDYNLGGANRRKIITAYREQAIHIACCLDAFGPTSPQKLRQMGTGAQTASILQRNVYGWFERVERGVYRLRPIAKEQILSFPEVVRHYDSLIHAAISTDSG